MRTFPGGRTGPAALALALTFVAGCRPEGGGGPAPRPTRVVRVAAASDLQAVFPALAARYARAAPGVEVRPTFGSSGHLAGQVRAGAPFDLFLSANAAFVRDLASGGQVDPATVRPYATGALVLAVHPAASGSVKGLADLAGPAVKHLAIADPDLAPYGAAARQALTRAGLWDAVRPRLVLAATVRQALHYVETGNAEAGLVGRSTAEASGARSVAVEPGLYDPIVQYLGVVGGSTGAGEGRAFAEFLTGPEGRAVFAAHGFLAPPAAP